MNQAYAVLVLEFALDRVAQTLRFTLVFTEKQRTTRLAYLAPIL